MAIESNAFDIFAIADIETEDVTFPETGYGAWGGKTFRLRTITADEREALLRTSVTIDGGIKRLDTPALRVRIVCLAVVDESGKRVFEDNQLKRLGAKSAKAIDFLADAAMRLAGIGDDEGDAGKGQGSTPTNDSSTS